MCDWRLVWQSCLIREKIGTEEGGGRRDTLKILTFVHKWYIKRIDFLTIETMSAGT